MPAISFLAPQLGNRSRRAHRVSHPQFRGPRKGIPPTQPLSWPRAAGPSGASLPEPPACSEVPQSPVSFPLQFDQQQEQASRQEPWLDTN